MIIGIFDIATQPLQELYSWIINVQIQYIISAIFSAVFVYGLYKAFRSVGMDRRNAKKWSNRASVAADMVQISNDNRK